MPHTLPETCYLKTISWLGLDVTAFGQVSIFQPDQCHGMLVSGALPALCREMPIRAQHSVLVGMMLDGAVSLGLIVAVSRLCGIWKAARGTRRENFSTISPALFDQVALLRLMSVFKIRLRKASLHYIHHERHRESKNRVDGHACVGQR